MSMSLKKSNEAKDNSFSLPMTLFITYLALLALCIALYALLQIYFDDKATATNLMIWSATIYAPIAVLFGFNAWKAQQYETSKIKAIERIKEILSLFNKIIIDHRLYGDSANLLRERDFKKFNSIQSEWSKKAELFRREIMSILERDGFYFESGNSEIGKLYKLNNDLLDVITEIEFAGSMLKMCWIGSGTPSPDDGTNDENELIIKRIYLIDPQYYGIRLQLDENAELKTKCQNYEKEKIYKPINNFFDYLNDLLRQIYKI